ncbi:MAG: RloB domain-containing protein [Bacteroidia bacterium]|nr:RloB domain-containing protein [Bacteroidia bacterium]
MARKPRPLKRSILIVCEGTVTEPNYFFGLAREVRDNRNEFDETIIKIDPIPREESQPATESIPHKSARKKRPLQKRDSIIDGEVEAEFSADPVRYVRLAQLGLMEGTYEEAYAVFDKDGHPARKEAFDLAKNVINGQRVQIAFSSISFEHWILLHFEFCTIPFEKSECKDKTGRYLRCGASNLEEDCQGDRCVAGYIRIKGYLQFSKKGTNLWSDLRPHLNQAMKNSAQVRIWQQKNFPQTEIFDLNPWSDIDLLIGRFLRV